jgi:hypothetical protein
LLSHRIGSSALLSLSLSPLIHRRPPPSYRAAADFLVMPQVTSSSSCLSLNRRAAAPFIVVPLVLLLSLRHRCLP